MSKLFNDDNDDQTKSEDFAKMLDASLRSFQKKYAKGDRVLGEIINIGKDDVFVVIGGKEGMVSRSELLDENGEMVLEVGDSVELYVRKVDEDLIYLTTTPSSQALSETLQDAFDMETPVDGKVTEVVNGGYRVSIFNKLAFCPFSQMDLKPVEEPASLVGRKYQFIVTKFEEGGRNIVLSRRKLLEMEKLENEGEFLSKYKVGQLVEGTVTRMEPFGAFIMLKSGVEGLAHISELSWSHIKHPSDIVRPSQNVSCKIIKIEEDLSGRLKVGLSVKQAEEDPWFAFSRELQLGQSIEGKIKVQERFGWLIEIKPGLMGLLPPHELKEAVESGVDKKKVGETIRVQIHSIDTQKKRVGLRVPNEQDEVDWEHAQPKASLGTLGDQFKDLFKKK